MAEQAPTNDATALIKAALEARAAAPLQAPPNDDEVAAFGRAVDDVQTTLSLLTTDSWQLPAVNGLSVGELVGHLIGTQLAMAAALGLADPPTSTDHIESTREAINATSTRSPAEAADEFARVSRVLTDHLARLDASTLAGMVRFGPIAGDVRFLLLVRVFELWTHDNDLRMAVGLPRVEPDADRLWMMTRAVIPIVHRIGGNHIRIVLTGVGGGVWPAPSDEIAEIALDSVAFCRRVANRLEVGHLDVDIGGDPAAAHEILNHLAALALD